MSLNINIDPSRVWIFSHEKTISFIEVVDLLPNAAFAKKEGFIHCGKIEKKGNLL